MSKDTPTWIIQYHDETDPLTGEYVPAQQEPEPNWVKDLQAKVQETFGEIARGTPEWQATVDTALSSVYTFEVESTLNRLRTDSDIESPNDAIPFESRLRIAEQRLALHLDRIDQRQQDPAYQNAFELAGQKMGQFSNESYADLFILGHLGVGPVQNDRIRPPSTLKRNISETEKA